MEKVPLRDIRWQPLCAKCRMDLYRSPRRPCRVAAPADVCRHPRSPWFLAETKHTPRTPRTFSRTPVANSASCYLRYNLNYTDAKFERKEDTGHRRHLATLRYRRGDALKFSYGQPHVAFSRPG